MNRLAIRRLLAAALTAVALVSTAARPLLACQMGSAAAPAAAATMPEHHHHAPQPKPAHPVCDHLIGCTVMAAPQAPTVEFAATPVGARLAESAAARPDAPTRSIEPPPPRA